MKKFKIFIPILAVGGLATIVSPIATLASCGCGTTPEEITIELNKNETNILVGDDETLIATVTPSKTVVTWSSSDENIATVDTNGKVTAKATGETKIIADAGGKKAECVVKVGIEIAPVCIEANAVFTFELLNGTKHWTGEEGCKLEFSIDGTTFTDWDGSTSIECENKKIYLRGTGIKAFGTDSSGNTTFQVVGDGSENFSWEFADGADIRTLLNYQDVTKAVLNDYCFAELFCLNSTLKSIPASLLPFKTLSKNCYQSMFSDCTGLTSIPESLLPATTLAKSCYNSMFKGCTGLTTLPAGLLPVGKDNIGGLVTGCYERMFMDCSGLEILPSNLLPATALAISCYSGMFARCANLKTGVMLNSNAEFDSAYDSMFFACEKLKISEGEPPTSATQKGIIFTCPTVLGDRQVTDMFSSTIGTFTTGTPTAGKTYYWYIEEE